MWDQFESAVATIDQQPAGAGQPRGLRGASMEGGYDPICGMSAAEQRAQVARYEELSRQSAGAAGARLGGKEEQVLMAGPFVIDDTRSPPTQPQQQQQQMQQQQQRQMMQQQMMQRQQMQMQPQMQAGANAAAMQPQAAYANPMFIQPGSPEPPEPKEEEPSPQLGPQPVPFQPPPTYEVDPFLYEVEVPVAPDIPDSVKPPNPADALVGQLTASTKEPSSKAESESEAAAKQAETAAAEAEREAREAEAALSRSENYAPPPAAPDPMRPMAPFGAPATALHGMQHGNDNWAVAPPDLGTLGAQPKPDPTAAAPSPFVLQRDGSIIDARDLL